MLTLLAPTGVEFAGELADFFEQDLRKWIPEIDDKFHVTLVEALPTVCSRPMASSLLMGPLLSTYRPGSSKLLQTADRLHGENVQRRED